MTIKTHRDLVLWRKAIALAARTYKLTAGFAGHDRQTLSQPMRRCAVAVATNIAEGAALGKRSESIRCLDIARGCLLELETQVCLCIELGLLPADSQVQDDIAVIGRLLATMIRRLREHRESPCALQSGI